MIGRRLTQRIGWGLAVACALGVVGAGYAQTPHFFSFPSRLDAPFEVGVQAFDEARYARAIPALIQVFRDAPGYYRPDFGSAAYWLGQAYYLTNQPEVAARVWAEGWQARADTDRVDLRLADALVRSVFGSGDRARYEEAARAYLILLANLEDVPPDNSLGFRRRHLVPLASILPGDVRAALALDDTDALLAGMLPEGTGTRILAWWRSQDPLPATPENERLYEHLERVAYAERQFTLPRAKAGYDDRGAVYIRFGPPGQTTPVGVTLNDPPSSTLGDPLAPFYPEGLFWVYRHVHEEAHYLFVHDPDDGYRLGRPEDLVPRSIRYRRSSLALMDALRDVYRMLALYHPRGPYGSSYEAIENYLGLLEDVALARTLPSGAGTFVAQPPPPAATAFSTLSLARAEDRRAVSRRDAHVPPAYSNVYDDVEALPVALRWVRFLDDDGTTRTEVYWGLRAQALQPSRRLRRRLHKEGHELSGTYLLDVTLVQQAPDYRYRATTNRRHLLSVPTEDPVETAVLPVQSFSARGDTGRYHLALQWDAYLAVAGAQVRRGERIKLGAARIDSLQALNPDPARLEMSDLVPLRVDEGVADPDDAPVFPQRTLTPDIPLALAFEVYHLTYGPDDRTRYRVSYDVARSTERPGLLRMKRPTSERSRAETTFTGDRSTVRETVRLDLGEWEGAGELVITVRVTDIVSGQTARRSLTFEAGF